MNWLEFFASILKSTAWPAVVVVAFVLFRRPIKELIGNKKIERWIFLVQRSDRAHGDHLLDAEHFECADICAVVDLAGREAMATAVASKKCNALTLKRSDHDDFGRIAERRLHADVPRVRKTGHPVKTAAANNRDLHRFFSGGVGAFAG